MTRWGRGWWCLFLGALAPATVAAQVTAPIVRRPQLIFEDAQLFHPATDPSRFISIYDTRNLDPGRYTLGIYGNFAANPIELQLEDSDEQSADVVNYVGGADLVAAIGITDRIQLGIDIPYIFTDNERVLIANELTEDGGHFLGDISAEAKFTLLARPPGSGIGFSILPRIVFPSGDRENFAGTGEMAYGGLLLLDARFAKINYGLNFGGFIRDEPGNRDGGDRFDDYLQVGGGVTVPTTDYLDIIGEVNGRAAYRNDRTNPFEAIVGFRFHWGGIAFTVGGGAGLTKGRGAPEWRVLASLTPYIPEKEPPIPRADLVTNSRKTWGLAADVDNDGRPNPADTIEYTVNLINTGTKAAEELVFVDQIPDRTTYVPGSMMLNGQPVTDAVDGDGADFNGTNPNALTVKVGTIPNTEGANAGTLVFRVVIDPEIIDLTVVRNEAIVYHKDQAAQPGTDPETGPRVGERIQVTETTVFPSIRERETVVVTPDKLELTRNIHFEFDKATIRPESFPVLDDVAGVLGENAQLNVTIEGHTDSVGSVDYNQKLSHKRAQSVREYLVRKGITTGRLDPEGRGESAPIASNDTPVGRAMNRRVEFLIVNPETLKGKRIEKRPYVEDISPESEPASVEARAAGPGGPTSSGAPTGDRATLETQRALSTLGYNPGELTGIMTAQTANAIRTFQKENGLPVTGSPDVITRKALDEAMELQRSR